MAYKPSVIVCSEASSGATNNSRINKVDGVVMYIKYIKSDIPFKLISDTIGNLKIVSVLVTLFSSCSIKYLAFVVVMIMKLIVF